MSTNYYLHTNNKSIAEQIGDYTITDSPDWGYLIHIGKRACGWLPLFQAHPGIKSVQDIEMWCKNPEVRIYDEYDSELSWEQLKTDLICFNGGTDGAIPKRYVSALSANSPAYDANMPNYVPVSHFSYGNGKYAHLYFKDEQGYEFTREEFC